MNYAIGTLSESWSLAVATHAALCPVCRDGVLKAEAMGGVFVDEIAPVPMAEGAFNDLLARLDTDDTLLPPTKPNAMFVTGNVPLPEPLRSYLLGDDVIQCTDLPWQRLGLGAYHIPITLSDRSATARLLRIPAGRPVAEHGHGGSELTLVLAGAFHDGSSYFGPGDFQETDETLVHKPRAIADEDCICLAVTDAPLSFSNPIARLIQPFLNV
tara:strand:- start:656 stop:1294 length:639 start_codon:yes stop_codon:yes gene_type:complete